MMFSPEAVIHTEASPSITQSVCLYGQRGVCTFVVGVMVKVVEVVAVVVVGGTSSLVFSSTLMSLHDNRASSL